MRICGLMLLSLFLLSAKQVEAQENETRTLGWVALATGTGLSLAAWDWRYDCKKGLEESYLGYECYADTDKVFHTKFERPKLLYAGIATGTLGLYLLYRTAQNPNAYRPGISTQVGPNYGMITYRFW